MSSTTLRVREARDRYLEVNGFRLADYSARFVPVPIGPFTFPLPNSPSRQALVGWHDLHHVATGYGTDLAGEGEVGAFELRAGSENLAGYLYNGLAVLVALFLAPRRVVRAFRRARGARTLYGQGLDYEAALELPVVELRRRMRLPPEGIAPRV